MEVSEELYDFYMAEDANMLPSTLKDVHGNQTCPLREIWPTSKEGSKPECVIAWKHMLVSGYCSDGMLTVKATAPPPPTKPCIWKKKGVSKGRIFIKHKSYRQRHALSWQTLRGDVSADTAARGHADWVVQRVHHHKDTNIKQHVFIYKFRMNLKLTLQNDTKISVSSTRTCISAL